MIHTLKDGLLLEFETVFPNEVPSKPEEYLKGGKSSVILHISSFFLGFKHYNSAFKDNRELIGLMFSEVNSSFANRIYERISLLEKQFNIVQIINPYSSLRLFELFFSRGEEPYTQTEAEFERNLFKAYLVLNSEYTSKQQVASESVSELEGDLKHSMRQFCAHYLITDKTNYDIDKVFITQIIKAVYLFQYLEEEKATQPLLKAFLKHFNHSSWQSYLKKFLCP